MQLDESATQYDADFQRLQNLGLTWLPWVGQRFSGRPTHKRLLVVGDSHYYKNQDERKERNENRKYTREVVSEDLVNQEYPTPTLKNISKLLFKTTEIDHPRMWGDSAYFNIVQRLMNYSQEGREPKKPYGDDFIAGWKIFAEIVRIIQPSHCLFIGVSAASTFDVSMESQKLSFEKVSFAPQIGRVPPRFAKFEIAGTATKLMFVHHLGWNKNLSQWHDYLQTQHGDFMSWLGAESYPILHQSVSL